jgi:acetolactate synthase I/II/III large subunit
MILSRTGADALCDALTDLHVEHVFGVPGTQSIALWDALRRSGAPKPVVAVSELGAAFMANGYARASGRLSVVVTIPGPGFAYALPGIAEARLDSVPLVQIAGAPAVRPDGGYALQAIAQADIAAPLVKRVVAVDSSDAVVEGIRQAAATAVAGEPGPVLFQITESALSGPVSRRVGSSPSADAPAAPNVEGVATRLQSARRPLLICGQGAAGCSGLVRQFVQAVRMPVLTTTSGRGVVSEDDPFCLPFDSPGASTAVANRLVAEADVILALGVKFSHNGSLGFALRLPSDRLIRVDASSEVLARGYPADVAVEADAGAFLEALSAELRGGGGSTWAAEELETWRNRLAAAARSTSEPLLAGLDPGEVFGALSRSLPPGSVVTTDSGLHQYLARRHLIVRSPRSLVVPTDFQSMGFGIPAAFGAAIATDRPAVAVIGDGGFAIGGLELAKVVAAGVPLVVVVLVDRSFGLIRVQQLRRTGHESGVELPPIDLERVAAAVGARHVRLERGNVETTFREALASERVVVVEIPVEPDRTLRQARRRGLALSTAGGLVGRGLTSRMADVIRRRRS